MSMNGILFFPWKEKQQQKRVFRKLLVVFVPCISNRVGRLYNGENEEMIGK